MEFITLLEAEFKNGGDSEIARQQKAYLRNKFECFGMKAPIRRAIQKPFLAKEYLPPKEDLEKIVKTLWSKPQREFHHFAQELTYKYKKQFEEKDIELFEYMVTHKSWWDTIDFIAPKLIADYFKMYPHQREIQVQKWLASGNIWLQRCCLLFQLHYKETLDTEFLEYVINSLLGSNEFFINKAIGWVLRQYSRVDADWVVAFANKTELAPLSRKEALRLLL
jgi:3-methyladenine DNA glycosylase AlkD